MADLTREQSKTLGKLLYNACFKAEYETAVRLLGEGAPADYATWNGKTTLHAAAESGSAAVVSALLNAGADPDARDNAMRTAYDVAKAKDKSEAAALLAKVMRGNEPKSKPGRRRAASGDLDQAPLSGRSTSSRSGRKAGAGGAATSNGASTSASLPTTLAAQTNHREFVTVGDHAFGCVLSGFFLGLSVVDYSVDRFAAAHPATADAARFVSGYLYWKSAAPLIQPFLGVLVLLLLLVAPSMLKHDLYGFFASGSLFKRRLVNLLNFLSLVGLLTYVFRELIPAEKDVAERFGSANDASRDQLDRVGYAHLVMLVLNFVRLILTQLLWSTSQEDKRDAKLQQYDIINAAADSGKVKQR